MGFLILLMALPVLATTGTPGGSSSNDDQAHAVTSVQPDRLEIHTVAGRDAPPPLTVRVNAGDTGWSATSDAPWIQLERIGEDLLTVSVDHTSLERGIYRARIQFEPGDVIVPVMLEVHQQVAQAEFEISPAELDLTLDGDDAPIERSLTIAGDDGARWSAVSSAPWLRLSSYSGNVPEDVTVLIDPAGLPAGNHDGVIWIGRQRISVSLEVISVPEPTATPTPGSAATPEASTAEYVVEPAQLVFAAVEDGRTPAGEKVEISATDGAQGNWRAEASESWIELSTTSGIAPGELWVGVDFDALRPGQHEGEVLVGDAHITVRVNYLESATPDPAFDDVRDRNDLPVEQNQVARSWLWGLEPLGTLWEPYEDTPGGERLVQYYDKGRLEISDSDLDPGSPWYVNTGLLALEMISGEIQIGEDASIEVAPAEIPVAGDAENNDGPTYAALQTVLDAPAFETGSVVTYAIDRDGEISNNPDLAEYGVRVTGPNATTGHTIASVFWEYLNSSGLVWEDGLLVERQLFDPWYAVFGLPITEPYWADVTANGKPETVLIQCFERRCLTYTPSYDLGWQVELANVGSHYFIWRYEQHFGVGGAEQLQVPPHRITVAAE